MKSETTRDEADSSQTDSETSPNCATARHKLTLSTDDSPRFLLFSPVLGFSDHASFHPQPQNDKIFFFEGIFCFERIRFSEQRHERNMTQNETRVRLT